MAVQSTLVQLVFLWWLLLANWFDRMHRLLYFGPSIKSKIWKTALDCCLFLFDSRLAHFVPTCTKWTISFGDVCSSTTVFPWAKTKQKSCHSFSIDDVSVSIYRHRQGKNLTSDRPSIFFSPFVSLLFCCRWLTRDVTRIDNCAFGFCFWSPGSETT